MEDSAVMDEFSKRFKEDFYFIACISSATVSYMWFMERGASCHMIGCKDFFTMLQEGGMNLVIDLGDDKCYKVKGVGTFLFQRELGKPLSFSDVLYVLGLKKNLISVSTLEDKWYEVNLRKGSVFVMPTRSSENMGRMIGVREEKVYKLQFQPGRALVSTTINMGDLWHRRMAHIHFGALWHLRKEIIGLPKFTTERHDPFKGFAMGRYV
jgi:hypothetical protein